MKSPAMQKVFGSIAIAKQVPFSHVESVFDAPICAVAGLTKVVFTSTWSAYVNGSGLVVAELSASNVFTFAIFDNLENAYFVCFAFVLL